MNTIDKLTELFERFPGIGPRQARRFVFHLLTEDAHTIEELARLIGMIKNEVAECAHCFRFFARNGGGGLCSICDDSSRDETELIIVERDADIAPIERAGIYRGYYFVLGGTVPLLNVEETKKLRGGALKKIITDRMAHGLKEVILGFSVNPDGENTARYVRTLLEEFGDKITIHTLGRGLSTGSELEYMDPETLKNALENRK